MAQSALQAKAKKKWVCTRLRRKKYDGNIEISNKKTLHKPELNYKGKKAMKIIYKW